MCPTDRQIVITSFGGLREDKETVSLSFTYLNYGPRDTKKILFGILIPNLPNHVSFIIFCYFEEKIK